MSIKRDYDRALALAKQQDFEGARELLMPHRDNPQAQKLLNKVNEAILAQRSESSSKLKKGKAKNKKKKKNKEDRFRKTKERPILSALVFACALWQVIRFVSWLLST